MFKIGFTGTREGMTYSQIEWLDGAYRKAAEKYGPENIELHHGDCKGADAEAHEFATRHNIVTVIHPPDNQKLRAYCRGDIILPEKPYLERNLDIIEVCNVLIGMPRTGTPQERSGTWFTILRAAKAGKPIRAVLPDGTLKTFNT